MSNRIQHGRIDKSPGKPRQYDRSLQKKASPRHEQGYTFRPTEQNRRKLPANKNRHVLDSDEWRHYAIEDLAYAYKWSEESFLTNFVLGEKFDWEGRPDLITAFRSLDVDFHNDNWNVGQKVLERGFTRTLRKGSQFYFSRLAKDSRVLLSCDETKYDQFIHVTYPPPEHWTRAKTTSFTGDEKTPDVTLDTATFDNTIFSKLDDAEREGLARFPVQISFHGMPIRLERLFIDNPDKKATYLTIAPLGFHSSSSRRHPHYLTMRLNEEGQDEDWAEKLLGLPHHFFGAYVNSETEDLTCAHFKPIQASEIEGGFRFEAHGNVVGSCDGYSSIELYWESYSMFQKYGGSGMQLPLGMLLLEYSEEELDLLDGPSHIRGTLTTQDNESFISRGLRLECATWRCCAFEPESAT